MQELFPEYLKKYFNPDKIDFESFEKERSGYILPNGLIILRANDTLEEQVLALLHEVTHLHPKFISYTGGLFEGFPRDNGIEKLIEKHAFQIYRQRPDVIRFARKTIEKAKLL